MTISPMLHVTIAACDDVAKVLAKEIDEREIQKRYAQAEALAWAQSRAHFRMIADNDNEGDL